VLRIAGGLSKSHKNAAGGGMVEHCGSLLTRYGWMQAGHASARDWRLPLEIPEDRGRISNCNHRPTKAQDAGAS